MISQHDVLCGLCAQEERAVLGGNLESDAEKEYKHRVSLEDHPSGCLIRTHPPSYKMEEGNDDHEVS